MKTGGCAVRLRIAGGLAAALLLCAVALTTRPAMADTGTAATVPTLLAPGESTPPEDTTAWWWKKRYLALYKTISYTAVVLTTDQLWYMAMATQSATSSGFFGVANLVTSPMLTYGFEYAWQRCCEAPPGPDGVRPVDVRKALIYRVVSTARILVMALAFGNDLGSSLLVTGAIAVTRTFVYMGNDYVWNAITAQAPPIKWPTMLGPAETGY
jgi:hypothetical protein